MWGGEVAGWGACFFFFQAEDGIRDYKVTGVQTCALPISARCGRPARVALLRDALLLGAQLGIEGAERIIEPLVDRRPALLRSLSRPVGARGGGPAPPPAPRRGPAGRPVGGGAPARPGPPC